MDLQEVISLTTNNIVKYLKSFEGVNDENINDAFKMYINYSKSVIAKHYSVDNSILNLIGTMYQKEFERM